MGYRKVPTIYTLTEFKNDPGLVVRMKAVRIGELRKLIRVMDTASEDLSPDGIDELFNLLLKGLVSWNLEGEDGQPIPADMEGLEELELPFVLEILNAWLENMTGVDDELGKGSPSGGNFPGQPLTAEAL